MTICFSFSLKCRSSDFNEPIKRDSFISTQVKIVSSDDSHKINLRTDTFLSRLVIIQFTNHQRAKLHPKTSEDYLHVANYTLPQFHVKRTNVPKMGSYERINFYFLQRSSHHGHKQDTHVRQKISISPTNFG